MCFFGIVNFIYFVCCLVVEKFIFRILSFLEVLNGDVFFGYENVCWFIF